MKQLIINADDFGMSREVNEGTKKGIKQGVITSVSVMTNMPYFDDAIAFLKQHTHVSVGLHFNVTEGAPLQKPTIVAHLLREDNNFFAWPFLIGRAILSKDEVIPEIADELKLQYLKLEKTGLKITHIDSHHHIHLFPSILKQVFNFAKEKKIASIRCHEFNTWNLGVGILRKPNMTQVVVNAFLFLDNLLIPESKNDFKVDRFFDLNWAYKSNKKQLSKILENLPNGYTEFICHLAVASKSGNYKFLMPREKTLELLTDTSVKKHLLKNGVKLINRNSFHQSL